MRGQDRKPNEESWISFLVQSYLVNGIISLLSLFQLWVLVVKYQLHLWDFAFK